MTHTTTPHFLLCVLLTIETFAHGGCIEVWTTVPRSATKTTYVTYDTPENILIKVLSDILKEQPKPIIILIADYCCRQSFHRVTREIPKSIICQLPTAIKEKQSQKNSFITWLRTQKFTEYFKRKKK